MHYTIIFPPDCHTKYFWFSMRKCRRPCYQLLAIPSRTEQNRTKKKNLHCLKHIIPGTLTEEDSTSCVGSLLTRSGRWKKFWIMHDLWPSVNHSKTGEGASTFLVLKSPSQCPAGSHLWTDRMLNCYTRPNTLHFLQLIKEIKNGFAFFFTSILLSLSMSFQPQWASICLFSEFVLLMNKVYIIKSILILSHKRKNYNLSYGF